MVALVVLALVTVVILRANRPASDRTAIGASLINVLVSPDGSLDILVLLDNPHSMPVSNISCDLTLLDPQGDAVSGVRTTGLETDKTLPPESQGATTFYLGEITETVGAMEGYCWGSIID